ncbi:CBS domain-containing protein [Aneurinibacillus terranovensis]|uniref:CBS domain-containing protein n=1 Tax=Aneurinibacillus terranovensis TaxID=278991 RepID=UPI00040CD45F|nr:CBS domain-containing protein [Aneurinibacillus terranovensis]
MAKKLRDIMTASVECVTLKDNIYEVAVKMKENDVGVIPVVDEQQRCIGLITDRDIVIRSVAEKKPNSISVDDIMSKKLITAHPDMTAEDASHLMAREQIRRLPVVENDKLVGMVAMRDLATHRTTHDEAGYAIQEISETEGEHSQGSQFVQ